MEMLKEKWLACNYKIEYNLASLVYTSILQKVTIEGHLKPEHTCKHTYVGMEQHTTKQRCHLLDHQREDL